MSKHRCYFVDCTAPVTHTVQRLWKSVKGETYPLQYSCPDHLPGSKLLKDNRIRQRFEAAGRGLTPFYRVEPCGS